LHGNRHDWIRVWVLACVLLAGLLPAGAIALPVATVQQQAAVAKARIDAMESQLSATMSDFSAAQDQLAATRADIAQNRTQLKALSASIKSGQSRLSAEAVFLYRTDGNGFAEALLSAGSFAEFADRLFALSRIAVQDATTVERLKHDRAEAAKLSAQLATREQQQAAQLARVAAKRSAARSALNGQQAYANSLSAQVAAALQAAQNTESDAKSTPKPVSSAPKSGVVWATVTGRGGRYAVLSGAPTSYSPTGVTFDGEATWYGNVRPNMGTSSGRPFDENEFTCAHKSLPFGTRIAVTFRGRRVIVTVTDRGPYGRGRVIDLTKRAAAVIGLKSAGVGQVHCEVVRPN